MFEVLLRIVLFEPFDKLRAFDARDVACHEQAVL
jgi:hypothetical protein